MGGSARDWTCVCYPDSCPDLFVRLQKSHCAFGVSPLHQPDADNAKPHYHLIYKHGNTTTLKCVREFLGDELGVAANGYVEPVRSFSGACRYLIHEDDPDKEQFPAGRSAIRCFGGFVPDFSRPLSSSEQRLLRVRLLDFIEEHDICEYYVLCSTLRRFDVDLADYAWSHTIAVNSFLNSRRFSSVRVAEDILSD